MEGCRWLNRFDPAPHRQGPDRVIQVAQEGEASHEDRNAARWEAVVGGEDLLGQGDKVRFPAS